MREPVPDSVGCDLADRPEAEAEVARGQDSSAVAHQERPNRLEPVAGVVATEFPVPMLCLLLVGES